MYILDLIAFLHVRVLAIFIFFIVVIIIIMAFLLLLFEHVKLHLDDTDEMRKHGNIIV